MIKPYQVTFHLYADDESEVKALQTALYDLVCDSYEDNIFITADQLTKAIRSYTPLIQSLFK